MRPDVVVDYIRRVAEIETTATLSDAELLARFLKDQSAAAFETLVHRHGPMVLRVCTRILASVADAEDAYQATFLVLARRAASIHKRQSIGSWLHGVALRVARRLRAGKAKESRLPAQSPQPIENSPLADASWRETLAVLDEELSRLGRKYRDPLILCFLEERTQDEAARQLAISLSTLKRHLDRGRDLLRARLTRRGIDLSATLLVSALAQPASAASLPPVLAAIAGTASPSVIALVKGVIFAMQIARLKVVAAVCLCVTLIGSAAGVVGYQATAEKPQEKPPVKAPAQEQAPVVARAPVAAPAKEKAADSEEVVQLRKKKRDVAAKAFNSTWTEFVAGRNTTENVIDWSRQWLKAEQEIAVTPQARLAACEAHLSRMKEFEKLQKKRLDEGRLAAGDFSGAQFARYEAEVWVKQFAANKETETEELTQLRKSKKDAAAKCYEFLWDLFKKRQGGWPLHLFELSERLLYSEQELATTQAARTAALLAHLERMTQLDKTTEAQNKANASIPHMVAVAHYARCDAEVLGMQNEFKTRAENEKLAALLKQRRDFAAKAFEDLRKDIPFGLISTPVCVASRFLLSSEQDDKADRSARITAQKAHLSRVIEVETALQGFAGGKRFDFPGSVYSAQYARYEAEIWLKEEEAKKKPADK